MRSALIGLCASSLSDICSNSLRVLKTTKQTAGGVNKIRSENENVNEKMIKSENVKNIEISDKAEKNLKSVENKNDEISYQNMESVNTKNKLINGMNNSKDVELKNENNKIDVLTTNKSYIDIAKDIIEKEGLGGLFGRGLQVS